MAEGRIKQKLSWFVPKKGLPDEVWLEEQRRKLEKIENLDSDRLNLLNQKMDLEAALHCLKSAPEKERNGEKIDSYRAKIDCLKRKIEKRVQRLRDLGAGWL